ncbi:MAG: MBL fold metallo-hydrolase, partial [Gammaproteobacteria bacterium]
MQIKSFFHQGSSTFSYLVIDPATRHAAVIDPVLDYDASAGRTGTAAADGIVEQVRSEALTLDWILETHAHADHLSAAQHVKKALGGRIAIGE